VLRDEVNAAYPHRGTASDGMIGDARHQAENGPHGPGSGSDHNGWVRLAGVGVVRAFDITNDPALGLPAVAERLRARALAGTLPQVAGGGYLILAGRITAAGLVGVADLHRPRPARLPPARVRVPGRGRIRLARTVARVHI
jgi:hypothetical protein